MAKQDDLRESWFGAKPRVSANPLSLPPPPPPERAHGTTFALGATLGAVGGAAALACAAMIAARAAMPMGIAGMVGARFGLPPAGGFVIGAAFGAVLGGLYALVMRHAPRFVARAVFASAIGAALWLCAHIALVRHHAALPLVPMLLGACVHGVFVACVPPSRR